MVMAMLYTDYYEMIPETDEEEEKHEEVLQMLYGSEQEATISEISRRLNKVYCVASVARAARRSNSSFELNDGNRNNLFEDSHANSEEKNAKDDVFDFDLHEVSPHGQTLLHYNVFFDHDDFVVTNYLLAQGLDINKKDNFGRTPLYYLLASFNGNILQSRVERYLSVGARVTIPREDPHFYYFDHGQARVCEILRYYMYILNYNPSIDYRGDAITDDIKQFFTNLLRSDRSDRFKWSNIILQFGNLTLPHIFSYFYCLVQDVCSDLRIELQLFHPENRSSALQLHIGRHVEILKFLISKGIDMNDLCSDSSNNFMDHCILNNNIESVEFLASIGVRPKSMLCLLTEENNKISPKIKKLVKENCFNLSLKNMCRLKINKSLNVDETVKKVPRSIGEFIKFKTNQEHEEIS